MRCLAPKEEAPASGTITGAVKRKAERLVEDNTTNPHKLAVNVTQERLRKAQREHNNAINARNVAFAAASAAGVTNMEIADVAKLTKARVGQILAGVAK